MITAIEARVICSRKQECSKVLEYIGSQIKICASNGLVDYNIYHDDFIRKFNLRHLSHPQLEDLVRDTCLKLTNLGFEVKAYKNKIYITWSIV
ncbi:hypothetical protein [Yersinia phage vB_YenM_P744]